MRGVTGGAIVAVPLLFTMEMWWRGQTMRSREMLILFGVLFAVNYLFSLFSGLRLGRTPLAAFCDAVTSVGLGIFCSALILWLVGDLTPSVSAVDAAGKILLETAPFSIGASFANSLVRERNRLGEEEAEAEEDPVKSRAPSSPPGAEELSPARRQLRRDLLDAAATLAGATVFAMNVAPTEEVLMIAGRLSTPQLLLLLAAGILLCYIILYASEFEEHQVHVPTPFQHPVAETVFTCALSLGVTAGLLLLVGFPGVADSWPVFAACVVTLGFIAIVGGAAGRLII